ncbi:MAG: DUF1080 domain-containing protein [Phycisphaerales bacterium]|nr:DUF1080 domain-containing protein [Phycisphaerales bacterium]
MSKTGSPPKATCVTKGADARLINHLIAGAACALLMACTPHDERDLGPMAAAPTQWISLFNGRDLTGWNPFLGSAGDASKVWFVRDGIFVCAGSPVGYIKTVADYTNFELELQWRFDGTIGAGNSGVLLRVQDPDQVWPKSIEAQLQSRSAGDIWNIGEFPMQAVASRTEGRHTTKAHPTNEKPLGEWNTYSILLDHGRLELRVNGELQNVATDCEVVAGKIALQSEGSHIEFRNIRIRPLE